MAFLSGFDGALSFNVGPGWGPTVTNWRVTYLSKVSEYPAQRNFQTPRIIGRSDWRANVIFNWASNMLPIDVAVGQPVTVLFKFSTSIKPRLEGVGLIEEIVVDDPLDGPVTGTAVIVSNDSELTMFV